MKSCIYEGKVRHRRNVPTHHQFDFRTFMLMLDLDELSTVFSNRWLWSTKRMALARLRQSDRLKSHGHLDSLRQRAEAILVESGINEQLSSVSLLTQVRYLGFEMNPVCFYYCFSNILEEKKADAEGAAKGDSLESREQNEQIVAIIAEVNNTPWGEQHNYIVAAQHPSDQATPAQQSLKSPPISKTFHVSPFLGMNMDYRMAFSVPGQKLGIKIENHIHHAALADSASEQIGSNQNAGKADEKILDVTMLLERTPMTGRNLNWMLIKYPLISFKTFAGIYWQALRLYLKKVPFYPHPKNLPAAIPSGPKSKSDGDSDTASNSAWVGR